MNQTERREVIRDDYGHKHYEILQKDGETFIFDYGLGRFLEKGERVSTLETIDQINEINLEKNED